jgi:hypothetical protein
LQTNTDDERIIKRILPGWPCGDLPQTSSGVKKKKNSLSIVTQMNLQFYKPLSHITTSLYGIFRKNLTKRNPNKV